MNLGKPADSESGRMKRCTLYCARYNADDPPESSAERPGEARQMMLAIRLVS